MSKKIIKLRYFSECDGLSDGHHSDVHSDSHSDHSDTETYATFVPKMAARIKNFDSKIACKGCSQLFPCYEDNKLTLPSGDYFRHCVENCEAYAKLGLVRKCDKCKFQFLNANRLGVHRQRHHPEDRKVVRPKVARATPEVTNGNMVAAEFLGRSIKVEDIRCQHPLADYGHEHDHDCVPTGDDGYAPFVPKIVAKRIKSYNATIACKGCSKTFPCSQYARECHPAKSYYVHCIKFCPQYAQLGLIRKCDKCRLSFIDPKNLGNHLLHHHRQERVELISKKPDWMSFITLKNIMTFASYTDSTPCKGCGKMLSCIRRGRHSQYSLEFYIHCIEECDEYKKLGLIARCDRCQYVFINAQALRNHKCVTWEESKDSIPRLLVPHEKRRKEKIETPSWMSEGIARNIRACSHYPDKTSCKGCGDEFHYRRAGSTNHYSLEYYKHCIEECPEYRKLGLVQSCDKCSHLFLNKLAYAHHRC
ncbi:hypothetical protein HDE_09863 [Halotydeus destructor]|nr:hypothetical protein HDE_09863 [Halotydeus destructor]